LGTISRERFIRLGTALGVGAACASLVACGGGASSSGGGGSGGGESGGGGSGDGGSQAASSSSSSSQAGSSSGSSQAESSSSGGGAETGGAAIAKVSEVAPGSAFKFKDSGNPAVLVHLKSGDFVAYSAVCTHQGCTVAYKGGQLACPCHGSVFDPAKSAEVVAGPAPTPLPKIPVQVEGGEIVKA
jgi:cytochrome b6-f complex iron-sulfur subunit